MSSILLCLVFLSIANGFQRLSHKTRFSTKYVSSLSLTLLLIVINCLIFALSQVAPRMAVDSLGGKVIVTGIGRIEDDEFMLNLLNEQVQYTS